MDQVSNIYIDLTREFNQGRLRAVICSGQAVVLHRLAIMSKDGDWILKEDDETLEHVRQVLSIHGACYRFGAPLDIRWLRNGWSSHFEFKSGKLRIRTDFFTRPPRLTPDELNRMWSDQEENAIPFVSLRLLALLKMSNREKDYVVIGEIARRMTSLRDQILFSRSARDLIRLREEHPDRFKEMEEQRPALHFAVQGWERLEEELDRERRAAIHANERRLEAYLRASESWRRLWPQVAGKIENLPLDLAHLRMVEMAEAVLPWKLEDTV